MNEANKSLVLRWARWQTRTLARVWPEESRRWGEAIASEAEEIEQPVQALGWALGGATVYLRALGAHLLEWLKMPVGERSRAMEGLAGAPGPKRSRLFTMAVLVCAAGLLCLPEGREAIRTVTATWKNYAEVDASQGELEKLAKQAEQENDAQAMAFAALDMEDGKPAMELADRAVKLEPRLFWIYEARRLWPSDTPTAKAWIAKAQAADPQNAASYLRAADAIANRIYMGLVKQHSPTEAEENQALAGNTEWVALMDKAFRAPAYNSYYREDEELSREVWRQQPQLSLATVLSGLWMHTIPNLLSMERFTKLLVRQAGEARAAGQLERAQELLGEAEGFSKRMETDAARNERFEGFGLSLERESVVGWKAFYEETGQTTKAQEAGQQLARIEQRGATVVRDAQRLWQQQSRHGASGWFVQVSALLMVIAASMAALGIGLFEVWPAIAKRSSATRWTLAALADFGPAVVLLASAVLLLSFVPYARVMAGFREGNGGRADVLQLSTAFWSLESVTRKIAGPDTAVLGWTALTVVLSLVAALLLARMVYRAMRKTAPQV